MQTPQIKQASVNGVTLVYQEQGDGAPVVFIHGCCTDYRAWDAQRQAIAPHYRFIGLNMRYFGTAPWPDGESKYSQQTDADDIVAFIRGLNAGPVDLVGWSYSGPIVMLVLLQHPELVHSLTIHEPGSVTYVTDPAIAKTAGEDRAAALGPVIAAAKAGDFAGAARLTPIGVNHQPDFWETTTPEIRTMFLDNARTWTLAIAAPPQPPITCEMLHQIKMPVLITVGADTRSYFHIAAEGAAVAFPASSLSPYLAAIWRSLSSPRRSTRRCCNYLQRRVHSRSPDRHKAWTWAGLGIRAEIGRFLHLDESFAPL